MGRPNTNLYAGELIMATKTGIPKLMRNFHGIDGFVWAVGVVEDRFDPLKLGRVKARYLGWNTESKLDEPTDMLPWSYPLIPLDSGRNVVGLKEGDWVLAFFRDSINGQRPVIMGILPGIPEVVADPSKGFNDPRPASLLAGHQVPRDPLSFPVQHDDGSGSTLTELSKKSNYPQNEKTIDGKLLYVDNKEPWSNRFARNELIDMSLVQAKKENVKIGQTDVPTADTAITWTEPKTPYAAKYPYNHAHFSEAGHLIEIDDTPGAERLHWYHRTGTFREIHPDGTLVEKNVGDEYHIVLKGRKTHIEADDIETVDKGKTVYTNKDKGNYDYDIRVGENGNMNIDVKEGNLDITVNGDVTINSSGDANIKAAKGISLNATDDLDVKVGGSFNLDVTGGWLINGSSIVLNALGGLAVSVAGAITQTLSGTTQTITTSGTTTTTSATALGASPGTSKV